MWLFFWHPSVFCEDFITSVPKFIQEPSNARLNSLCMKVYFFSGPLRFIPFHAIYFLNSVSPFNSSRVLPPPLIQLFYHFIFLLSWMIFTCSVSPYIPSGDIEPCSPAATITNWDRVRWVWSHLHFFIIIWPGVKCCWYAEIAFQHTDQQLTTPYKRGKKLKNIPFIILSVISDITHLWAVLSFGVKVLGHSCVVVHLVCFFVYLSNFCRKQFFSLITHISRGPVCPFSVFIVW